MERVALNLFSPAQTSTDSVSSLCIVETLVNRYISSSERLAGLEQQVVVHGMLAYKKCSMFVVWCFHGSSHVEREMTALRISGKDPRFKNWTTLSKFPKTNVNYSINIVEYVINAILLIYIESYKAHGSSRAKKRNQ